MSEYPTTPLSFPEEEQEPEKRLPMRAGTVTWGVIMVAIAALFFATTRVDLSEVSFWVIAAWSGLGLGAILIVGGLISAATRSRTP